MHREQVGLVHPNGADLAEHVVPEAAPAPVARRADQASGYRVAMDVPHLLDALPLRPDIEVVEPRLPDVERMAGPRRRLFEFTHSTPEAYKALREALLNNLHNFRWVADLRFAEE